MSRSAARARHTHPPGPPLTAPPIAPNRCDITGRTTPAATHTRAMFACQGKGVPLTTTLLLM
eukprot:1205338-Prymnesium_polylepis.1